ncbi:MULTISPECIES: phytochelatin synthase family protein [Methanoculleus]|jgi:hypothetical protein|uniref:glutathione gamma-glutamylcysteinyltransferase n=1 Tax=Methanoculleus thermophilus TaxID=2200 RepID=A0A1G9AYG3_9EURY|nr:MULTISPECIES: phytochelatin synthase family protein [Methanoculleus]NLN09683.1 glutathione gamma-glutamylcysteinyltransferase [Methanoculleus thermophilus]SDK32379.1 Phytochelatin synthase [Methanoculleus thermophilus]HQD25346.1 phytochelatin synthase family protein [Methanoculleus thermophilus]
MKKLWLTAGIILGVVIVVWLAGLAATPSPLPQGPIAFDSPEGRALLFRSTANADYFLLAEHFVTQEHLTYCGPASMVMVLNGLGVPAPETPEFGEYRYFTQDNLFERADVREVADPEAVSKNGMFLREVGAVLEQYGVNVTVHHADEISVDEFRRLASENLARKGDFIIVNYLRTAVGQVGGGHFSPIAAYDRESDRFLVLDVSRYKYPPAWISTEDLFLAMDTVDSDAGELRGFISAAFRPEG